jgi:NAD(P)-dependent dehydrogenase (short-subunit alcohol dehydrogenase family)
MIDQHTMAKPQGAALVTGAARRIGRAIALDLAHSGWPVAVHYHRSADDAAAVVAEIERAGGKAAAVACDLAQEREVETLVPRAVSALGPLACLVNNASVFEMDKIETVTRASWDAHVETNLRAPLVLSQAFARQLPDGSEGNIVNLLDQRVWNLTPYFLSYTVSKMGLWTLTQTLALALAPRIRVNGIGPGPTLPSPRQTEEQFQRQWSAMPLARGTTPEEICQAVRFLLGAPAVTGQMIALDGGQHLAWALPSRGLITTE